VINHAFEPHVLATDLAEVRDVFATFFAARKQTDWEQHTEKFNRGWTLRETVAHLDAVAQAYQHAITCALVGETYSFPGITQRTELPSWNRIQIEARASIPISTIFDSFLNRLQQAEELAAHLEPAVMTQTTHVPFYHRPITIGELLGGQAAHPGMVHGAQVANGAGVTPLWVHFSPEMLSRQITRFFHLMSLAYWPKRGGNLRAVVTLSVAGPGGGDWYVTMTPEESTAGEGKQPRPTLRIWFRNADALCRALTLQISPLKALLTAQAFAWGDLRLGFQMGWLFNPA
jgi:hypothetical protein